MQKGLGLTTGVPAFCFGYPPWLELFLLALFGLLRNRWFRRVSSVAVPADFFSLLSVFFARFFSACFLPLLPFGSSLLATVFLPPDFTDGEGFETTLPTDLSSEDAEATTDCGPFVFTVFFFSALDLLLKQTLHQMLDLLRAYRAFPASRVIEH